MLLRRARRASRRALRISRIYKNNRPHALREAGLVAGLSNRPTRARAFLARSVAIAAERGMRYEEALSLAEIGRLGDAWLWPESTTAGAEGRQRLADLRAAAARVVTDSEPQQEPAGVTLSLVDRFDTLLDHGRRLATGLSRDVVFAGVGEAAEKLLRAEDCAIFDVSDDGSPSEEIDDHSISSSLISLAIERGRPVSNVNAPEGGPGDSLVLADVRSFLCAPIYERGEVTACFYATHRGVGELFGDDELRLAEFIATVAGAALENARGFAEVDKLTRSLEERVEARTSQLTTTLRELERVNEELKEASEAKSDFVSMVSHELRTPLTPIVGLSSTMLQRWDSMDEGIALECLEAIHRQGTRLTRLVDDLLEVSRIESGTVEADPRQVNVAAVITTTLDELPSADGVDVRCPTDLMAMADPDRLQQILVNYLENARKYGRPPVEIVAQVAGPWVEISVRDHGDGVPTEFTDDLFQKFARSESAKELSGSGLGLSIVRGLARAQGGEAWYEPNEPHGSRFSVRLPLSSAPRRAFDESPAASTVTDAGS